MKNILYYLKLGVVLMLFCVAAAAPLAYVYSITEPIVKAREENDRREKYKDVLAMYGVEEATPNADEAALKIGKSVSESLLAVYRIVKGSEELGMAIEAAGNGYGGPVKIAVAIKSDGSIAGVKILDLSGETKGVGSRVLEDPAFLSQFPGKTISDPLMLGTDIDGVSGATISSRAVANGVNDAARAFKEISGGK